MTINALTSLMKLEMGPALIGLMFLGMEVAFKPYFGIEGYKGYTF